MKNNPDFISEKDVHGRNYEIVEINKMKFNGSLYSWSSDARGWFKDTKKRKENDITFYLSGGDWTVGRLREIIQEHINAEKSSS